MEIQVATLMLSALAQPTRLELFRTLSPCGAEGLAAGEIAARLNVPPSTASFHLSAMERAGLVRATRHGRQVNYAIRDAGLGDLVAFLRRPLGDIVVDAGPAGVAPSHTPSDCGVHPAFNVLFVCTANAARSVMAEAILTRLGGERFNAYSAGSSPAAMPSPAVIARLAALGHDTTRLRSKTWEAFARHDAPRMDFVIALCDTLNGQTCPDFGQRAIASAWPLPDPAKFSASPAEQATMIGELYASLQRRIQIFINLPFSTLDRPAVQRRLDELGDPVGG